MQKIVREIGKMRKIHLCEISIRAALGSKYCSHGQSGSDEQL